MPHISVVITDLDNTIYNWVDFYVPSFLAMVKELSSLTGMTEETLKASFKRLHEQYGTSEYSFAVLELDILKEQDKGLSIAQVLQKYSRALKAFRSTRKKTLRLYEGVMETLTELRSRGKKLVAHTDALMFHAASRLKQLGVEHLYDAIFAPPDHGFPKGVKPEEVRYYTSPGKYKSTIPIQIELDPKIRKPDPRSLVVVLDRLGVSPEQAIYVGDSLTRDILMAQRSGIVDVLAEYGRQFDPNNYAELVRITYWNAAKIGEETELRNLQIRPSWTIREFPDLLAVVGKVESNKNATTVDEPASTRKTARP